MNKIICGIYKITNPKGRIYIGQSRNVRKRLKEYKRITSGIKGQPKILNSLKKYGADKHKFEIIHECLISELNEMERYYQDLYSCIGKGGLNCSLTEASDRKALYSEETRRKISDSNKGKVMTIEQKKKISESKKGISLSAETKEKLRIAGLGRKMSDKNKKILNEYWTGRKHLPESIEKIRKSKIGKKMPKSVGEAARLFHTGRKRSDETKRKIGEKHKNKIVSELSKKKISENSPFKKLVINLENGVFYNSIKEASIAYCKHSRQNLARKVNGALKVNDTPFILI